MVWERKGRGRGEVKSIEEEERETWKMNWLLCFCA